MATLNDRQKEDVKILTSFAMLSAQGIKDLPEDALYALNPARTKILLEYYRDNNLTPGKPDPREVALITRLKALENDPTKAPEFIAATTPAAGQSAADRMQAHAQASGLVQEKSIFGVIAEWMAEHPKTMDVVVGLGYASYGADLNRKLQARSFEKAAEELAEAAKRNGLTQTEKAAAQEMAESFGKSIGKNAGQELAQAGRMARFARGAGKVLGRPGLAVSVGLDTMDVVGHARKENYEEVSATVGGAAGGLAGGFAGVTAGAIIGAKTGAVLGTFIPIPVVGNLIGGAVGLVAGGAIGYGGYLLGRWAGRKAAQALDIKNHNANPETEAAEPVTVSQNDQAPRPGQNHDVVNEGKVSAGLSSRAAFASAAPLPSMPEGQAAAPSGALHNPTAHNPQKLIT